MTKRDDAWKKNAQAKQRRYARGPIERLATRKQGVPKAKQADPDARSGGRPAARRAAAMANRLDMQAKVWRMLLQGEALGGTSFREIGAALGISNTTAWRYALAHANSLERQVLGDVKTFRMLQASQLQAIKKAHWAKKDQKTNADVILRAMEREAKLLGIDREADVGVYSAEQVKAMLRGLFDLFATLVDDIELRRQFALGIRRQLPAAVNASAPVDIVAEETTEAEFEEANPEVAP